MNSEILQTDILLSTSILKEKVKDDVYYSIIAEESNNIKTNYFSEFIKMSDVSN